MAMLRMSFSKVAPYAIRVISSRSGSITNAINGCDQNSSIIPTAISHHHHYSTDGKKQSDGKLAKIIKSEIKRKKMSLEKDMHSIPNEFPFIIEIDDPWEDHLTMSRVFCGEKIDVVVRVPYSIYMPVFDFDNERKLPDYLAASRSQTYDDSNRDSDVSDDANDDDVSSSSELPLEFIVKVSKENGKILEFQVQVFADKIKVDSVLVKEPAPESGHPLQSFGLNFVEEEGELQIGLREYLKIRGIKRNYYGLLCEKMVKKYRSRPMLGLKMLRNFIKE